MNKQDTAQLDRAIALQNNGELQSAYTILSGLASRYPNDMVVRSYLSTIQNQMRGGGSQSPAPTGYVQPGVTQSYQQSVPRQPQYQPQQPAQGGYYQPQPGQPNITIVNQTKKGAGPVMWIFAIMGALVFACIAIVLLTGVFAAAGTARGAASGSVGQAVSAGGYSVTVAGQERSTKNSFLTAESGRTYIFLDVQVISNRDGKSFISPADFVVRDSGGFEYRYEIVGRDPDLELDTGAVKGQAKRGWLTFKVPATERLTLEYKPSFTEIVIKINL